MELENQIYESQTFHKLVCPRQDLQLKEFSNCTFKQCDFSNLEIRQTKFIDCAMRNSEFMGSNLTDANFTDSDLQGSKFDDTVLEKADFTKARSYYIDPTRNKIKQAKFSYPEVLGLLDSFGIEVK